MLRCWPIAIILEATISSQIHINNENAFTYKSVGVSEPNQKGFQKRFHIASYNSVFADLLCFRLEIRIR